MDPQQKIEFVFRRLTEVFSDWNIGFPVLFALTVWFIVACLRREKIGTLALGLCFLIFTPLLVIGRLELGSSDSWDGILWWLAFLAAGSLFCGGFMVNLVREATGWKHPVTWLFALPVMPVYITVVELDVIPFEWKIASIIFLYLVHVLVTVLRAGLWLGLIVIAVLSVPYLILIFVFNQRIVAGLGNISWLAVLLPVLVVALFYVGMMYFKDAMSIHPVWAAFLGLLRCTVYVILAFVFLLPSCQSWETTPIVPKILIVFDVSGSMVNHTDVLHDPDKPDQARPMRQDEVIEFLNATTGPDKQKRPSFIERVLEKSQATFYRFGPVVDQHKSAVTTFPMLAEANRAKLWSVADWQRFLKPNKKDIVLSEEDLKKKPEEQLEERARREEMIDALLYGGTDVFGSVREAARAESGNRDRVQAIIVISDGRSNLGSNEALADLLLRANHPTRPINIYTVLVGHYQQPTEILNPDVQTAETARPDDRFPLKITISASASLRDQSVDVYLEAIRKKDASGKPIVGEKYVFPVEKGTFKGPGDHPQDTIDYAIDLARLVVNRELNERTEYKAALLKEMRSQLASREKPVPTAGLDPDELKAAFVELFGIGGWESAAVKLLLDHQKIKTESLKPDVLKKKLLEIYGVGEWEFVAKVPRHPRESFSEAMHKSDPPTRVRVQNNPLRVLLFAGGPSRDYQFVRALFEREMQENRVEMSVFLQTGPRGKDIEQGVPAERLLKHFPNRLGLDDPTDKFSSLNMYDVIIAFDPDWTALSADQLKNLKYWVSRDAGSVIFVAGPVYSYHLTRIRDEFQPLKEIFPVLLKDYRTLPMNKVVDSSRPYALHFAPEAWTYDFLKLDEAGEGKTAGWNRFFWGQDKPPDASKDDTPLRGLYNCYPVEGLQIGSIVLATFAGPRNTFMNDKEEMPYLVTMPVGNGKTVYLGSAESWRLRTFKESFHDLFWIRLTRFAAAGSTQQKKYGEILVARKAQVGNIHLEAKLKGPDLKPLPEDAHVELVVKKRGSDDTYAVGDVLTIAGGTGIPATLKVTATAAGVVTGVDVTDAGAFTVHPANPVSVTGGSGTGARFDLTINENGGVTAAKANYAGLSWKPETFVLRARQTKGEWLGWFKGEIKLTEPGEYEFTIDIPNTSGSVSQRIMVERPSLEMADLREDPKAMWELATDADPVLFRLDSKTKDKILADLPPDSDETKGSKSGRRLFFTLDKADNLPLCLEKKAPDRESVKGPLVDWWDAGSKNFQVPHYLLLLVGLLLLGLAGSAILFAYQLWIPAIVALSGTLAIPAGIWAICSAIFGLDWVLTGSWSYSLPRFVLLLVVPFAVGVLGCAIAMSHRQWIMAIISLMLALVLPAVAFGACWFAFSSDWLYELEPLDFAFVMVTVVSLLGLEWLTRKLLKLA